MSANLGFLFAAFALTWAAFFVYLVYIQRLLADAGGRMRVLEREPSGRSGETPPAGGADGT